MEERAAKFDDFFIGFDGVRDGLEERLRPGVESVFGGDLLFDFFCHTLCFGGLLRTSGQKTDAEDNGERIHDILSLHFFTH